MDRRHFVQHGLLGLAGASLLPSWSSRLDMKGLQSALTQQEKILVVIYLAGGNDGLGSLIPLPYLSELSALRDNIFVPEDKLLASTAAEGTLAFHPALRELRDLYEEGQLHIIQNVGYAEPSFSHFRSTDIWMSGSPSDQTWDTGIMGRYLEDRFPSFPEGFPNMNYSDPLSVEIGYSGSLLFQGMRAPMSYVIENTDYFYELVDQDIPTPSSNTPAGNRHDFIKLITHLANSYGGRISEVAKKTSDNRTTYPNSSLGRQLSSVARLIKGGLQTPIYKVEIDGFDTHEGQIVAGTPTEGRHATLLRRLSQAIKAFMEDLEKHDVADKVLGMTFSEFGRRIRSNASYGTDHGTAAPMFLFGNQVKGGVSGDLPVIDRGMTFDDNLEHQYSFQQVYATIFEKWFCLDPSTTSTILGQSYDTLDIIQKDACSGSTVSTTHTVKKAKSLISLRQNPIQDVLRVILHHKTLSENIKISINNPSGQVLFLKEYNNRLSELEIDIAHFSPGMYFVRYADDDNTQSLQFVKN